MGDLIMCLVACLHILNSLPIAQQELFSEVVLLVILQRNLRNELPHIIQDDILIRGMQI